MDSIHLTQAATAIACLCLSLCFLFLLRPKSRSKPSAHDPPEPAGRWPIIGHLPLLDPATPLYRTLAALSDRYGPIFGLRLGRRPALVVSSWELAKECFTANDRAFAGRPALPSGRYLGYDYAMVGWAPHGPYWRSVRRILTADLFSARRIDALSYIWVQEVDTIVRDLHGELGPVEMKERIRRSVMNVVSRMVAGKRFFRGEGDEEEREFEGLMAEFFDLARASVVSDLFPFLKRFDIGGTVGKMKRIHKRLDEMAERWLVEHRRRRVAGEVEGVPDFMDVFISVLGEESLSDVHSNDIIIKSNSLAMLVAGTDTTSDTLVWALSLLLNNRHVLTKAQEELDAIVGMDHKVQDPHVTRLPYLRAIVKETMRLYPSAPFLVPHESVEEAIIGGYRVPAETRLFVNLWKIQRDPRVWSNPEEFQPDRFLTNNADVNVTGQHFQLFPFGSGRRSCPGMSFAIHVLHLTLARLLHSFEWSTPMDEPVDMGEGVGLTIPKAAPFHVLLRPRLPLHLYQ